MATRVPMSPPAVGSQSTSSSGSRTRQRASTTFCWLPPLSVEIGAPGPAATTPSRSVQRSTTAASAPAPPRPAPAHGGLGALAQPPAAAEPAQDRQREVLADRELGDDALA